jgi:hypothetical protein
MKPYLIILLMSAAFFSCSQPVKNNQPDQSTQGDPLQSSAEITFEKKVHEFNQIFQGEKVAYSFKFSNTGKVPLIIYGVRSGCGCTVGDYPKEPLKPGEQGSIKVVFNSSGRRGFQSESVSVLNNSQESPVTLRITAQVSE